MMADAQLQLFAPIRVSGLRHPMVTVEMARFALGVDAERVVAAIEDGTIAWAWDIAVERAARRRELRILVDCLRPDGCGLSSHHAVVSGIIGTQRPRLRGAEVERLLLCSCPHVKALHDAGELAGEIVGHTRHITTESLAAFLERRRVC